MTPLDQTPAWFDAQHYLDSKLAKLQLDEPGKWDMPSMEKAFADNGFSNPYDHYLSFGDAEGLNPNPMFNADQYLAAKAALLGSDWTPEMVATSIHDLGITYAEHYKLFGSKEGLNPSLSFDQNKYLEAKLDKLLTTDPDGEWTLELMTAAFEASGYTPLDHFMLFAETEGLTDPMYDYSVGGEPIPHPGKNITLTAGADIATPTSTTAALATSARDDIISGSVSSSPAKNTLNTTDVIDGGDGIDTLKVDMQFDFKGFKEGAGVTNVEKIELLNASGRAFNATGVKGVQTYIVDGGEKGAEITNVDSADTAFTLTQSNKAFAVTLTDEAAAGRNTDVTVTLNGVGTDAKTRVTLGVDSTTPGGVENLTLVAKGASSFVTLGSDHSGVTVTGSGAVDMTVDDTTGGDLITFNGVGATGNITLDLKGSTEVKSVITGAGNDTVTLAKKNGFTLDGGEGADTLILNVASGSNFKGSIAGFETIQVADASAFTSAATINLNSVSDDLGTFFVTGKKDLAGKAVFDLKGSALESLNYVVDSALVTTGGLTYDGEGVLNVSLDGTSHTAVAGDFETTIGKIEASKATEMTITNADAKTDLTVTTLTANALVNLTIDAANNDVTITGGSAYAALETITVKGDGNIDFTGVQATGTTLTNVDALELEGELFLDLKGFAESEGVTVDMGIGGGKLEGTAGADTFNLDAGEEQVLLRAQVASASGAEKQNGGDTINDFDFTYDSLSILATANDSVGATFAASAWKEITAPVGSATGALAKNSMFSISFDWEGALTDTTAGGAVELALASAWGKGGKASGSDVTYALLTDGDDVGIYQITFTTAVASTSAVSAGDFYVELMGVIAGKDIQQFDASLFVA